MILRSRPLLVLLAAVGFFLLYFLYAHDARYYGTDSDQANILLWARDVNRGNWLLSHWYQGTVSYYTSDILFLSLALRVLPFSTGTMRNVYPLLYTILIFLLMLLAARRGPKRRDWWGALAAFTVLGFPSMEQAASVFRGPIHMATFIWVALTFLALDFTPIKNGREESENESRPPWKRLGVAFVFLSLAVIADQLILYVALMPLITASLLRLLKGGWQAGGIRRQREIAVLGVCFASGVVYKLFTLTVKLLHGFKIPPNASNLNARLIDFSHLGSNIAYTFEGLLKLLDAEFFGRRLGRDSILQILGFAGFAAITVVTYSVGVTLWRSHLQGLAATAETTEAAPVKATPAPPPPPWPDRIATVLCLGIVFDLLAYALTNLQGNGINMRYLLPSVLYGSVLLGRAGVPLWRSLRDKNMRRAWVAALSAATLTWAFTFLNRNLTTPWPPAPPAHTLAQWLLDHHLTYGYGSYWAGSEVTVESGGRLLVAPVKSINGKIAPNVWIMDERWYEGTQAHFLVMENPPYDGVDTRSAETTFGLPDFRSDIAGYTVLVWNKDITPLLAKP